MALFHQRVGDSLVATDKTGEFTIRAQRDHRPDLDLVPGDNHLVNQQFDEVSFLLESRLSENGLHPNAKVLNGRHRADQFHLPVDLGLQLFGLGGYSLLVLLHEAPAVLVFGQGHDFL